MYNMSQSATKIKDLLPLMSHNKIINKLLCCLLMFFI